MHFSTIDASLCYEEPDLMALLSLSLGLESSGVKIFPNSLHTKHEASSFLHGLHKNWSGITLPLVLIATAPA